MAGTAASPCWAQLMMHAGDGSVLVADLVRLRPGRTIHLDYVPDARLADGGRVTIIPCIIPDPTGGRVLATAEVFDTATGRTTVFANPIAPRLAFIKALLADGR